MIAYPPFLSLSVAQQRQRFAEISDISDSHLDEAFAAVKNSPWSIDIAASHENRPRNRYLNVFPWDRTRVALPMAGKGSDYINASYIQLSPQARYIAAQGPLNGTIHHFWAMCFDQALKQQSDTVVVAMVTPFEEMGREKCARYWPLEKDGEWDLGIALQRDEIAPVDLKVTWLGEEVHSDGYLVTILRLQSGDVEKKVLHYYYKEWADTKVPDAVEPLISLSKEISGVRATNPTIVPIVHCSAGVGRTGTFIAVDYLRNFGDPFVDAAGDPVFELVKKLRSDRMMMVQTVHQYVFLYSMLTKMYKDARAN